MSRKRRTIAINWRSRSFQVNEDITQQDHAGRDDEDDDETTVQAYHYHTLWAWLCGEAETRQICWQSERQDNRERLCWRRMYYFIHFLLMSEDFYYHTNI